MTDKLIEIAKANGAVNGNDWDGHWTDSSSLIFESEDQLRATVEQVCAPLVEYAKKEAQLDAMMGVEGNAASALKAYRTLIGDKE